MFREDNSEQALQNGGCTSGNFLQSLLLLDRFLESMAAQFLEDIERTLEEESENARANVFVVFRYLEEHLVLTRILLSFSFSDSFLERLFSFSEVSDLLEKSLFRVFDERERKTVISFALSGSPRLIRDWITSADILSADDEASLVPDLAHRVCLPEE